MFRTSCVHHQEDHLHMQFMVCFSCIYVSGKEKYQCIRGKTGAQNIVKGIKQYQEKWLQHVQRMDTNRLPQQALQYKPKGRRNIGRPRKRWRDQLHLEDQGTGDTPKPSWTWWWWWWWCQQSSRLKDVSSTSFHLTDCLSKRMENIPWKLHVQYSLPDDEQIMLETCRIHQELN